MLDTQNFYASFHEWWCGVCGESSFTDNEVLKGVLFSQLPVKCEI